MKLPLLLVAAALYGVPGFAQLPDLYTQEMPGDPPFVPGRGA